MTKKLRHGSRKVGTGTFKATQRMRNLVNRVLDSGRVSYGVLSRQFEDEVADTHGRKYGVLSNSGTSSLHVALQTLKQVHNWADGDEVIVPAMTFVATINIVLHNNLKPVFVDVELDTYGINPTMISDAVTSTTRAIIPVHLFGQPCNMTGVLDAIEPFGLKVIEDSCETMFVDHNGYPVGSMGDIACFSFYNAHLITAGVGGMAITNNPTYASTMRSLVNHGLDIDELNVDDDMRPRPAVGRSFRFTHPGHSYRITELEAALGLAQFEDRRNILGARRRNARHLTAKLKMINAHHGAKLLLPIVFEGNTHAWMMYPILIEAEHYTKHELTQHLNDHGIETRDMMPITNQPIFSSMLKPDTYPIADWVNKWGFYIGCHQDLDPVDIEYTAQVFEDFFNDRHQSSIST